MEDFFYVIDSGTKSNIAMFSDVKKSEFAKQMSTPIHIDNRFLWALYKAHTSIKVNQTVDLPCKSIWDRYSQLILETDGTQWVIVTNWSIRRFSIKLLEKLQKDERFRLVMIYLDTYDTIPEFYKKYIRKVHFDIVYTMDMEDAKRYQWIYTNSLYSKNELPEGIEAKYDLYFVGEDKGRLDRLVGIYRSLTEKGVKCLFKIITNEGNTADDENLHFLNKRIGYAEILEDIASSRGILEFVQDGQSGMTMRPYEALFYNKRLLTNNPNVAEAPFFQPQFMRVFNAVDDELAVFLRDVVPVDYHYDNDYSPVRWLEKIPEDYKRICEQK